LAERKHVVTAALCIMQRDGLLGVLDGRREDTLAAVRRHLDRTDEAGGPCSRSNLWFAATLWSSVGGGRAHLRRRPLRRIQTCRGARVLPDSAASRSDRSRNGSAAVLREPHTIASFVGRKRSSRAPVL
jgi:hypothetical protein